MDPVDAVIAQLAERRTTPARLGELADALLPHLVAGFRDATATPYAYEIADRVFFSLLDVSRQPDPLPDPQATAYQTSKPTQSA